MERNELEIYRKPYLASDPIHDYAISNSLRLNPVQEKLIEVTLKMPMSYFLTSPSQIQLLQNIIMSIGAKKTLDIGVFTGYSAMSIALALPDDGRVVACDINEDYANIGKPYWKEAGVDHKIDLRIAPGIETLKKLIANGEAETFDFAFIDADKINYDIYYELCLKLIRKNGIIAIDDVLWFGTVLDPEKNGPETVALRQIAKKAYADDRVHLSFLVLGDGTLLLFKK